MKYLIAFLLLIFTTINSQAIVNDCDQNVNFNNGGPYGTITGDISCREEDGKLARKVTLEKGEIVIDRRYNRDGKILWEEHQKNGKRNGLMTSYYEDTGKVKEIQNYKDDHAVGMQKRFHPDGKSIFQLSYEEPGNYDASSSVYLNTAGNPKEVSCGKKYPSEFAKYCKSPIQLYSEKNEKTAMRIPPDSDYSGVVKNERGTGKVTDEVTYKDGKLNGPTKIYDSNGKLAEIKNYENSKLSGAQTTYFENSDQIDKRLTIDTKLDKYIKTEEFYQNGSMKKLKEYQGKKYTLKEFFDNGKPSYEATFEEADSCSYSCDKIIGDSKSYDKDGNYTVSSYDDKQNVEKVVSFDAHGKQLETKHYFPDGSEKK